MFLRLLWAGAALVIGINVINPAEAQDSNDAEAEARFTAGEIAFSAGRFDDALGDFQRAYELSERPELLYNIGLSAYRLRQDELALESFERFLELLPNHPNEEQVQGRIQAIHRNQANDGDGENRDEGDGVGGENLDDGDGVGDDTPQQGLADDPSRVGPWALGLAGGAAVIGGAVLLALALSDRSEIESMSEAVPWPQIEDQVDSVPRRSGVGIGLLAVGGAAALGAVLWRLVTPNEDVHLRVGAGTLSVDGQF